MGYSVLDFRRRRASGGFSVLNLFAGGGLGLLYEASVIGTLYQTTAMQSPPSAGGAVALTLDRSQSGGSIVPVFGAQKSDSGADATEWYASRTSEVITQSGSRTRATAQSSTAFGPAIVITGLVIGDTYLAEAACFASKSFGVFAYRVSTSLDQNGSIVSTPAGPDNRLTFIAPATTVYVGIIATSDASGDWVEIGDASVKEVLGNHARQTTGTLQSKYQTGPARKLYDGIDDHDTTTLKPTVSGTLAVRMRSDTASRFAIGSQPASNGRCYIGLASDGSLAGGIGTQATSVIKGSADVRGNWVTGILTWDGSTVTLYQDGVSVYSGAQSGAVNTTIDFYIGAINNNGASAAVHDGDIARDLVLDRAITAKEATDLSTLWSTIL
jgi:hypothetical protein